MLVTSGHNACGFQLSSSVWSFRVRSSLGNALGYREQTGCVHGCQVVCMVVRLCVWLSGCVHDCQVVCMVVYRTWCGCRECATCVLSRPTVSHITCWLPFVLCVLELIVVPCANCFVYLK